MYVDVDSLVNARNFSKVFLPTVKMCLPIFMQVNFAQSIVCSSPKNRLYMEIIKQMSNIRMTSNNGGPFERRGGWATTNALFKMGPPLYSHVVLDFVFGKDHSGQGNIRGIVDDMKVLQEEAGELIATGQFVNECNSFLVEPFAGCRWWDRKELYNKYNMTRWGRAVKDRWGSDHP